MSAISDCSGIDNMVDYLIVGAGPAGLQLGYYLSQKKCSFLILERGKDPGTFFKTFPRHRKMLSINKISTGIDCDEINLRWDWNSLLTDDFSAKFSDFSQDYFPSADAFTEYLSDFAIKYALPIEYNIEVVSVEKNDCFVVTDNSGKKYFAKRLIMASGLSKLKVPDFPGVEHCLSYSDYPIDPALYKNKKVMVLGKGNSALEVANSLINSTAVIHLVSPNPVKLAWNTHYVGHVRAVNNDFLDTYQLKSQNTVIDADITEIQALEDGRFDVSFVYNHAQNQQLNLIVDVIISCTGFMFDATIFKDSSCLPDLCYEGKYPQLTKKWESINVPDLYFAGTLMHSRDYKKSFSGFVHGFRYNVKCLHRLLEQKYEGRRLDYLRCDFSAAAVAKYIINRACNTSSLFQQPAFFSDAILFRNNADSARATLECYQDLPLDYVLATEAFNRSFRLVLTLEYGKVAENTDPFNIPRVPNDGSKSTFIHPVIRYFEKEQLVSEYHIPEDLENLWDNPMYTEPFLAYITQIFSALPGSSKIDVAEYQGDNGRLAEEPIVEKYAE